MTFQNDEAPGVEGRGGGEELKKLDWRKAIKKARNNIFNKITV